MCPEVEAKAANKCGRSGHHPLLQCSYIHGSLLADGAGHRPGRRKQSFPPVLLMDLFDSSLDAAGSPKGANKV